MPIQPNITIFFGERKLILCNDLQNKIIGESHFIESPINNINNIVDNFEKSDIKTLQVQVPDINDTFNTFAQYYKLIQAAGGLVRNQKNEVLLIYRLSNWDLPKGKIEKGETRETAAVREVEEECGIHNLYLENLLTKTYHVYFCPWNKRNVIKETFWYNMQYKGNEILEVQTEESITDAKWVEITDLKNYFDPMYSSIKEVLNLIMK